MHNKQKEWPDIFKQMNHAAMLRGLVPFLTEFGGSHDWEDFYTDLPPYAIYQGKQIRAYMNLQFIQAESLLLNAIYWNYDLYNTAEGKDHWNLENFSVLGPDKVPRHIDILSRPYPMRSSAKPYLLFFDLETKHCALILKGAVVKEPTVIYLPYTLHYYPNFKVWATSSDVEWDQKNQLIYWHPDEDKILHQIIVSPIQDLNASILPDESRNLLGNTKFTFEYGS